MRPKNRIRAWEGTDGVAVRLGPNCARRIGRYRPNRPALTGDQAANCLILQKYGTIRNDWDGATASPVELKIRVSAVQLRPGHLSHRPQATAPREGRSRELPETRDVVPFLTTTPA